MIYPGMPKPRPPMPNDLAAEYEGVDLGDERRNVRLPRIAAAAASDPSASFRETAEDDAALEATYRLLNNPEVEAEDIWGPHQRQSLRRMSAHRRVIAVHDTTGFAFEGETARHGLGPLRKASGQQGFFLHATLMLSQDEHRTPLGIASFETYTRDGKPKGKQSHKAYRDDPFHEGRRWLEGVRGVQALVDDSVECVHVADRECDGYEFLAAIAEAGWSCVIRMCSDRATTEPIEGSQAHVSVRDALELAPYEFEREVHLSRRGKRATPSAAKYHPSRDSRMARIGVRGQTIELRRPTGAGTALPKQITIHAVQVQEIDPPEGQPPVEWTLLTTLPIGTRAELARIVDLYRSRWMIEEYFKALKTGCAIEKRQHESYHALRNALAIFLPIAWRMLTVRALAQLESNIPATTALTDTQLQVLAALAKRGLPESPTVSDAMWAIASLAGHHHRRTKPGWQTLGAAFEKLLFAETVWRAAREGAEM